MAKILQTPIINTIIPFDPSVEHAITFTYSGTQITKSHAQIVNNKTLEIVYEDTQLIKSVDGIFQHMIPPNSNTIAQNLIAGEQYTIQIDVSNDEGDYSLLSDPVLFYCFTVPEFYLDGLKDKATHKNPSISLDLVYLQKEGEPIRSFQFMQYSIDKTLLNSSEVYYSSSPMSYLFYGLEEGTTYYFRAIGETSHGIALDTGYIEVSVNYERIILTNDFTVENNFLGGYILLDSNMKVIGYDIKNCNYTIEDGILILYGDNELTYTEGFLIEDDFAFYLEGEKVKFGTFLISDDSFSLSIIEICGVYYCVLSVQDSNFKQYVALPKASLNNNLITLNANDSVIFEVKRINGYYSLHVYNRSEV